MENIVGLLIILTSGELIPYAFSGIALIHNRTKSVVDEMINSTSVFIGDILDRAQLIGMEPMNSTVAVILGEYLINPGLHRKTLRDHPGEPVKLDQKAWHHPTKTLKSCGGFGTFVGLYPIKKSDIKQKERFSIFAPAN